MGGSGRRLGDAGPGGASLPLASIGVSGLGRAWRCEERRAEANDVPLAWLGMARLPESVPGTAGPDVTWHGTARLPVDWLAPASRVLARRVMSTPGGSWRVTAWRVRAR